MALLTTTSELQDEIPIASSSSPIQNLDSRSNPVEDGFTPSAPTKTKRPVTAYKKTPQTIRRDKGKGIDRSIRAISEERRDQPLSALPRRQRSPEGASAFSTCCLSFI